MKEFRIRFAIAFCQLNRLLNIVSFPISVSDNGLGKENESRTNSMSNNKGSSLQKTPTIKTPVKKPPVHHKSSEKPDLPKLHVSIKSSKVPCYLSFSVLV